MTSDVDSNESPVLVSRSALSSLATEVWRIRKAVGRLERPARGAPGVAALRFAARSMERVLTELGVEIMDFQGHPYDLGMCMKVELTALASDARGGPEVRIVETLEPTVVFRGKVVVPGRVVVAPAEKEGC